MEEKYTQPTQPVFSKQNENKVHFLKTILLRLRGSIDTILYLGNLPANQFVVFRP